MVVWCTTFGVVWFVFYVWCSMFGVLSNVRNVQIPSSHVCSSHVCLRTIMGSIIFESAMPNYPLVKVLTTYIM